MWKSIFLNPVTLGVLNAALLVASQAAQVDQENWAPELVRSASIVAQQEFTPTLDRLDSVQLWLPRGDQLPMPLVFGSFAVQIRAGGINGPILAASQPTYLPPF